MDTFDYFPLLPQELRQKIWRHCLPNRVIELDWPDSELAQEACWPWDEEDGLPRCSMRLTSKINAAPPAISRVYYESRTVALETGHRIDHGLWSETFKISTGMTGQWFNPALDVLHLHYTTSYNVEYAVAGDPLPYLISMARRTQSGASLNRYLAESRWDDEDFINNEGWELSNVYSICFKVVCIHCKVQPAIDSGLFGKFGDERIVLVDARHHQRIDQFRQLWQTHGLQQDTRSAIFFFSQYINDDAKIDGDNTIQQLLNDLETMWVEAKWDLGRGPKKEGYSKDDVWEEQYTGDEDSDDDRPAIRYYKPNKDHPWVLSVLSRMPRIRPTIMLRLCTDDCYQA